MNAIPEEKLEKLTERWHAVQHELSNPLDQATFRKLSQEFAQLDPLVQTIKELGGLREEIAGLEAMVGEDGDREMVDLAKAELEELKPRLADVEQKLKIQLLPKDGADDRSVILEVRAGTGGDEAALFAADLFRMYSRYAEARRWAVEIVEVGVHVAERGGADGVVRIGFDGNCQLVHTHRHCPFGCLPQLPGPHGAKIVLENERPNPRAHFDCGSGRILGDGCPRRGGGEPDHRRAGNHRWAGSHGGGGRNQCGGCTGSETANSKQADEQPCPPASPYAFVLVSLFHSITTIWSRSGPTEAIRTGTPAKASIRCR